MYSRGTWPWSGGGGCQEGVPWESEALRSDLRSEGWEKLTMWEVGEGKECFRRKEQHMKDSEVCMAWCVPRNEKRAGNSRKWYETESEGHPGPLALWDLLISLVYTKCNGVLLKGLEKESFGGLQISCGEIWRVDVTSWARLMMDKLGVFGRGPCEKQRQLMPSLWVSGEVILQKPLQNKKEASSTMTVKMFCLWKWARSCIWQYLMLIYSVTNCSLEKLSSFTIRLGMLN